MTSSKSIIKVILNDFFKIWVRRRSRAQLLILLDASGSVFESCKKLDKVVKTWKSNMRITAEVYVNCQDHALFCIWQGSNNGSTKYVISPSLWSHSMAKWKYCLLDLGEYGKFIIGRIFLSKIWIKYEYIEVKICWIKR